MSMQDKKRYYILRKIKVKAFTFIECLVSVLVISGAILVYNALTHSISTNMHDLSENQEEDWLLFSQQLRTELINCRFDKIDDNKLYVTKSNQKLAFGQSKSNDFRKTNATGKGYQPMLFGVQSSHISKTGQTVKMTLNLKNGLERTFVYTFETTS